MCSVDSEVNRKGNVGGIAIGVKEVVYEMGS